MDNHRTPLMNLPAIVLLTALAVTCSLGAPASVSTDLASENQSRDSNEVGPLQENWQLFERLAKTNKSYGGPSVDPEKTRQLIKEIEGFSRLVQTPTAVAPVAENSTSVEDDDDDDSDSDSDSFSSASEWFDKLWKEITEGMDFDGLDDDGKADDGSKTDDAPTTEADAETIGDVQPKSDGQATDDDGGTVEEIIRKLNNDLKRLYNKIIQVITVVKNWISNHRAGDLTELTGSASEQEGVFVIANPLIGDIDKSNKYTLPINAE